MPNRFGDTVLVEMVGVQSDLTDALHRMLTELAFRHLDLAVPTTLPAQLDLLGPMPAEVLGEETP